MVSIETLERLASETAFRPDAIAPEIIHLRCFAKSTGGAPRRQPRTPPTFARRGLIRADTVQGPVHIAFPLGEADSLFPRLFAPAYESAPAVTASKM